MKKTLTTIGVSILAVAGIALAWWLFSPLFIANLLKKTFPLNSLAKANSLRCHQKKQKKQ